MPITALAQLGTTPAVLRASTPTSWWGTNPAAWDVVIFGEGPDEVVVPGLSRVSGRGWEQKVQRRTIPGKHGESLSFLGRSASEFDVEVALWTEEHLSAFAYVVPRLKPVAATKNAPVLNGKGKGPNLLDAQPGLVSEDEVGTAVAGGKVSKLYLPRSIHHPALALFGVTQVHVLSVSLPEKRQDGGLYVSRIHCLEYVPEVLRKASVEKVHRKSRTPGSLPLDSQIVAGLGNDGVPELLRRPSEDAAAVGPGTAGSG